MAKQVAPAWIEKCTVLHEGKDEPIIMYNISVNDSQVTELSCEQLSLIRDMIDKITKEN